MHARRCRCRRSLVIENNLAAEFISSVEGPGGVVVGGDGACSGIDRHLSHAQRVAFCIHEAGQQLLLGDREAALFFDEGEHRLIKGCSGASLMDAMVNVEASVLPPSGSAMT